MGAMELEENTVQIRDDFDPDKILESGQCFRPRRAGGGLVSVCFRETAALPQTTAQRNLHGAV